MKRWTFLLVGLLFLAGFAFAETITMNYGDAISRSYELNGSMPITVTIDNIPAHVHQVYVEISPDLSDHVYCAPGLQSHDANESWTADFTCILLSGSYSGDLYFKPQNVDVDANGNLLADVKVTRLSLSVVQKEVWYTNYGYTNIGGSITVGQYKITVDDADIVSADVTISKGDTPIWSGVMFIGQQIQPADDIIVTFNGYSTKRGEAFFTFKTRFPVTVSSSIEKYYIAAPSVVYADDTNKSRVDIVTNCNTVQVCDANDTCTDHDVGDSGKLSLLLSVGSYTLKCKEVPDVTAKVTVLAPVVITKTKIVEKNVDKATVCPSWFYSLPPTSKMSYCSSVCATEQPRANTTSFTPVQTSESAKWAGFLVLAAIVGYFFWKKYKDGGFSFGGGKSFEEPEKEIEAVPDVEG